MTAAIDSALLQIDSMSKKKIVFLQDLATFDNVSNACKMAGVSRQRAYQWRDEDAWFKGAWAEACQSYLDNFEASGRMLALQSGDSNKILNFLKYKHPKYREAARTMAVAQDDPEAEKEPELQYDYSKLTVSEAQALLELTEKCVL